MFNGKISDIKEIDEKTRSISENIRSTFISLFDLNVTEYDPLCYKLQPGNGSYYFIKVSVGNDIYVHLKIFYSIKKETSLVSFQYPKKREDQIIYF